MTGALAEAVASSPAASSPAASSFVDAPSPVVAVPVGPARELRSDDVSRIRERLLVGAVPTADAARIDLLRALEELKAAATAVQATVALSVDAHARAVEAQAGVPAERRGRDVPVRIGLALRESPVRARSFLGAAKAWRTEMPHTFAALRAGVLTPWRATILVKETAHLPVSERIRIDAELCADQRALGSWGTAALVARVRRRGAELDPAAAVERARRVAADRAVWVRPAPDTMTYVTALLPVAQGVGVYAALRRAADLGPGAGDGRSRGQIMADTLVERVTGQATADAVPVAVSLVVSDATLLGAGHEPGLVLDAAGAGGAVPAQVARALVAGGLDAGAAWLRRVYADPAGRVVAASSSGRFFADGLADVLRIRDQGLCRTPYCDAPVRHLDHVRPAADGGPTDLENGQGLCEACNLAKNAGGFTQVADGSRAGPHTVVTTTATGHQYASSAPPLPRPAEAHPRGRPARQPLDTSPVEEMLSDALARAA